jgi:hypothetical protein
VEFIKRNIKLDGAAKASVADSKKVVEICTQYAQKGMFNIFLCVFFATLAFAFVEPYFFIGYLISIALFGLFQAIFMANAGGAWDNAKKDRRGRAEGEGDARSTMRPSSATPSGDPFKDTSSVAMNPIIKFTTLFGLLAVELAVSMESQQGPMITHVLADGILRRLGLLRLALVLRDADTARDELGAFSRGCRDRHRASARRAGHAGDDAGGARRPGRALPSSRRSRASDVAARVSRCRRAHVHARAAGGRSRAGGVVAPLHRARGPRRRRHSDRKRRLQGSAFSRRYRRGGLRAS